MNVIIKYFLKLFVQTICFLTKDPYQAENSEEDGMIMDVMDDDQPDYGKEKENDQPSYGKEIDTIKVRYEI